MLIHNPTNVSRLCVALGKHLEPFAVEEASDGSVRCDGCRCILSGDAETTEPTPAVEPIEAESAEGR